MTRTSKPGKRAAYHHGDLKSALRAAATTLIAERGVETVSLREIAQIAGVSHTAAYRHYADKEAVMADLAEVGFRELNATMCDAVASATGGVALKLQSAGGAYVRFGVEQPHLLQLMFGAAIADWQRYPDLVASSEALYATLTEIIRAGQEEGKFRAGDPAELALAAWSLVHGLALLICGRRVTGSDDASFVERASQRVTALLIEGLTHQ
ncbi:TetR/AcrR family transcriptional regulator [Dyella flagellata]|uniref:TetR family transcriptional regulator n=1 Tax=Dyella flagellata TaxID=1867833 RepID=A0ABQ5X8N6_9GAMM|nr:TetR/AcrR family transcriptional regulator [Dyella flagellata]GLQ87272.1 TetR family transcriptional regulator [Dyella flagellata]